MKDLDKLLDNEREWRRYMIAAIEEHRKEITQIKIWSYVFRITGGILLSLLYIWIDNRMR